MPRRIAISTLNASTIDIINTIRANAPQDYQDNVPVVTTEHDIPKVGEALYGYPAFANHFISSLMNRIAMVRVKSAVFNNAYAELKKGYLEFGETVEEVFVNIAKAREFSAEKAEAREFKRTLPDVRSAFHTMNWRVQYPITIQDEDLRMAFLSMNGVQDLIAKIVDSIYTAAEYDEFLLFKYLIIKGVSSGKMYPVAFDSSDMKNAAKSFRGTSNMLTFMKTQYNASGVHTSTPRDDQYIFMDATFNAAYDVDVLAAAFNMDKSTFMGHLKLIDDFTTFDNDRFDIIREGSDMIEPVTDEELRLMTDVKAVICDREWFQVYDNNNKMTEKYVSSGMYWNYFYNVWKTVSYSPFSNAVVFVADGNVGTPATFTVDIASKSADDTNTVFTLVPQNVVSLGGVGSVEFEQSETAVNGSIAVHKYGAVIMANTSAGYTPTAYIRGVKYQAGVALTPSSIQGEDITFTKVS